MNDWKLTFVHVDLIKWQESLSIIHPSLYLTLCMHTHTTQTQTRTHTHIHTLEGCFEARKRKKAVDAQCQPLYLHTFYGLE